MANSTASGTGKDILLTGGGEGMAVFPVLKSGVRESVCSGFLGTAKEDVNTPLDGDWSL